MTDVKTKIIGFLKKLNPFKKRDKYKEKRESFTPVTVIMLVVLIVYSLLLVFMIAWAVMTAFKEPLSFLGNSMKLPEKWTFDNFITVFNDASLIRDTKVYHLEDFILHSIMYALGCSLAQTTVACITAYLCSKYRYKYSKIVYAVVIVVMSVPIVGSQSSELEMAIRFGLYNHIWGLWIMKANFLGMYFLVFYEMFKSIPMAYSEAAKIDGAGDFAIMVRIAFPLVRNTYVTVLLIHFIQYWNDYQIPMLYVPDLPTLAEYMFSTMRNSQYPFSYPPVQMAASCMLLVPVLVLFLCFHKKLLGNLSIGGVKG